MASVPAPVVVPNMFDVAFDAMFFTPPAVLIAPVIGSIF